MQIIKFTPVFKTIKIPLNLGRIVSQLFPEIYTIVCIHTELNMIQLIYNIIHIKINMSGPSMVP